MSREDDFDDFTLSPDDLDSGQVDASEPAFDEVMPDTEPPAAPPAPAPPKPRAKPAAKPKAKVKPKAKAKPKAKVKPKAKKKAARPPRKTAARNQVITHGDNCIEVHGAV